jgi:CLIP-associating protein 1/2
MQTKFKDKESEFNWEARESSIIHLRALLHGNAVQDWLNEFAQGIHDLTDAILKGVKSYHALLRKLSHNSGTNGQSSSTV